MARNRPFGDDQVGAPLATDADAAETEGRFNAVR
jgi:hypothetical protein